MDAIITLDETQRIVQFNAAAEKMFGCSREKAMGTSIDWFIPPRYRAAHAAHVQQFGTTGVSSRRMGAERIIMGLRANGEEFPIDASISQTTEHGAKFYTVILRDVTERVRTESELRRSKAELSEFASAAHTVREQEKSRIARELHDELGQALTALKMDVSWLRGHVPADSGLVRDKLARMEVLLNDTVTATRRISTELRPLILDDLGVIAATESLVDGFTQRTGVPCELIVSDPDLSWRDPLATTIFRIVQESLTNIARHAKASHASVEISQNDVAVVILIRDDGIGFAMDDPRKPNSYGLMGLRERAYLLGGDAHVSSRPGHGTRIEVSLPLTQQRAAT
ncbi:MAG: PAS domain S-box protein [Burkholderiales bacterium]|nr:PAS domain S-box protein [Burkholderiales bacterium]